MDSPRPRLRVRAVGEGEAEARDDGEMVGGHAGEAAPVVAVAATILTAAYYILRDGVSYRELGPDHFVERDRTRIAQRLARQIRELGYEVTIREAA